jgi:hypothetical protein
MAMQGKTVSRMIAIVLLASMAGPYGCSGMGKDAPAQDMYPNNPPLTSFLPVFLQLAHQGKTDPLTGAIQEIIRQGQVQQLVDALDASLRAVGTASMKIILQEILHDTMLKQFFAPEGPFQVILDYPNVYQMLDTLHLLNNAGLVENGIMPLVSATVDSPLLRVFKDAGREMLRDGIPSVLGLVDGFASEKVDFEPSRTGKVPALTPLLQVLIRDTKYSDLQNFLFAMVDILVNPKVTPLMSVLGGIGDTVDADKQMGRQIVNGLGNTLNQLDQAAMNGLRATVSDLLVNKIPLYPKNDAPVLVNIPDKLYVLFGADGKGGQAIMQLLRDLGPSVVENIAPAFSVFVDKHCVNPVKDPDMHAYPTGVMNPSAGDYSCFMQMVHMVFSMYQKQMGFDEASRKLGAQILTWQCSPMLEPDDPEWDTAVMTPDHGLQPLLPSFPINVAVEYHENMARRTTKQAVGYTSYINCILHGKMGDMWVYELSGLSWEVDVVGFASLEVMARSGALDLYVPLLNLMRVHPDGKNHVKDTCELLASFWGLGGSEINPLSFMLDSAINYPTSKSSLVFNLTRIIDSVLYQKVPFGGQDQASADILVDALVYLTAPVDGGKSLFSSKIAAMLLPLITTDIDQYVLAAKSGIAAAFQKPEYKAEGIFTLMKTAFLEQPGAVSFTDYLDPSTPYYQKDFTEQAHVMIVAFTSAFSSIAEYFYNLDPDGVLAELLSYTIRTGSANDALQVLDRLMDYDQDNKVLDFISRLNKTGALLTVVDMLDAVQQAGLVPSVLPVFQLLTKKDVIPEFMDLLNVFLPKITLGEDK